LTFGVYNGQKHIPVNVSEDMIGQKFGEYSPNADLLWPRREQEIQALTRLNRTAFRRCPETSRFVACWLLVGSVRLRAHRIIEFRAQALTFAAAASWR
jgi:hypothetical protein